MALQTVYSRNLAFLKSADYVQLRTFNFIGSLKCVNSSMGRKNALSKWHSEKVEILNPSFIDVSLRLTLSK